MSSKNLVRLKKADHGIQLLKNVIGLLHWDQETYMPEAGLEERSEQLAFLEGEVHERQTKSEVGELIWECEQQDDLNIVDSAFIRESRRIYDRETKLPKSLVTAIARQASLNHASWISAKEASDFSLFRNDLYETVRLTREKAEHLGFRNTRYDPLLDEFEPWMKTSDLESVLHGLREPLVSLLDKIRGSSVCISDEIIRRNYDIGSQRAFSKHLLNRLNFSRKVGRLDVSAHPFSITLGANDGRLTTRFNPNLISSSIFGTIHECGHGHHGLAVLPEIATSVLGHGASLGICESQSRLWENIIGRSRVFWEYFYPNLKNRFNALEGVDLDTFYESVNCVKPSNIRVEADEVTYNLHILLRFSLEKRLVDGEIEVDDLREAWRDESHNLLGIVPSNDSDGVLQDIHWSMFSFGYFPTYSLGNIYSAQFFSSLKKSIRDWENQVKSGQFSEIQDWLRKNIQCYGRVFTPSKICKKVSGQDLNPKFFVEYLTEKFGNLYRL